ncbi:hypothetical protein Tco_0532654 [Tanacetum coccineum]
MFLWWPVAVEDLMIVAEQGFKDYNHSDISIHQRVKVLSRLQRSVEVKAKQEKDMSEYPSKSTLQENGTTNHVIFDDIFDKPLQLENRPEAKEGLTCDIEAIKLILADVSDIEKAR